MTRQEAIDQINRQATYAVKIDARMSTLNPDGAAYRALQQSLQVVIREIKTIVRTMKAQDAAQVPDLHQFILQEYGQSFIDHLAL